jgi:lactate dehydrogenase-like 2-hydroxyacid dehydrogenase
VFTRTHAEFQKHLPQADALITCLSDRVDTSLLTRAPKLRAVANYAVGYDNIDMKACHDCGVRVTNTPDVLTRATAELALALLLAAARRIPEGESLCRTGRFRGWEPSMLLGLELEGRTAVILGQGRIGQETAKLFRGIGMKTLFITRHHTPAQIRALLKRAQILSIHTPLTPATRHWVNRQRLSLLPKDAIVINTARGPVIDEAALAQALRAKRIFAAGLDVYEREPKIHSALRQLNNVVLLPHLGSATEQTRLAMARLAAHGAIGILSGKHPANEVR